MNIQSLLWDNNFDNKNVLKQLISFFMDLKPDEIWTNIDKKIPDDIFNKIKKSYLDYKQNNKPLEYIFWYVEFLWNKFNVDSNTLIPRPETEYMILSVNEYLESLNEKEKTLLLDIWTWCWVLWISSLYFNKQKINSVVFSDISKEALLVAEKNFFQIIRSDFDNAFFIKTDLFNLDVFSYLKSIDKIIIVSNLPYIPDKMFDENAPVDVRQREPRFAFVWWDDWLDLYRKMFNQIISNLDLYKKQWIKNITMFLEMMTWQVDILKNEFKNIIFYEVKTFHFNIRIVRWFINI